MLFIYRIQRFDNEMVADLLKLPYSAMLKNRGNVVSWASIEHQSGIQKRPLMQSASTAGVLFHRKERVFWKISYSFLSLPNATKYLFGRHSGFRTPDNSNKDLVSAARKGIGAPVRCLFPFPVS